MIENWWSEVDGTILDCLWNFGPMSPAELGRRVGISEGEATMFLSPLVQEGRARMHLVDVGERTVPRDRPRYPVEEFAQRLYAAQSA